MASKLRWFFSAPVWFARSAPILETDARHYEKSSGIWGSNFKVFSSPYSKLANVICEEGIEGTQQSCKRAQSPKILTVVSTYLSSHLGSDH